mmetsp:Transcript_13001/g.40034  ORF Transcript_13001/g.40034 Transcript_13001/m.40034 type:complete len:123 (+) Transcript_13001:21-389(+)
MGGKNRVVIVETDEPEDQVCGFEEKLRGLTTCENCQRSVLCTRKGPYEQKFCDENCFWSSQLGGGQALGSKRQTRAARVVRKQTTGGESGVEIPPPVSMNDGNHAMYIFWRNQHGLRTDSVY